jgi:hypothetical protein
MFEDDGKTLSEEYKEFHAETYKDSPFSHGR